MSSKIAIVLDDHNLFGESFAVLLEKYRLFEKTHTFQEASKLISFLTHNSVKEFYIFFDYYLNNTNGLGVMTDIQRLNKRSKIIFMTSSMSWPVIYHMMSHQPHAIISKSNGLDILMHCITEVRAGNFYLCPTFTLLKEQNDSIIPVTFTPRELEILQYFSEGNTIVQTAEKTFLSRHTIVAHRRNMMAKANCTSMALLLGYAKQWELI